MHPVRIDAELRLGVAGGTQEPARRRDPEPVPLHQAEHAHRLGEDWIPIVDDPRLPEVAGVDHAVRTTGAADLDAIVEPVHVGGRVRVFVGPVHDGVAHKLLHGIQRVGRIADLDGPGQEIDGRAVVCDELVVEPAHDVRDCTPADLRIRNAVAELRAGDPDKLRVSAGKKVLRSLPEDENAADGRHRFVDRHDHLGGGESLFRAPVVAGQRLRIDGRGEIVLLEAPQAEVGEARPGRPGRVEVRVSMTSLLVQDPLVLRAGVGSPRTDANPYPSLVADRRRV